MRTMVFWVPDWPVVAARTVHGLPPASPVAIVEAGLVVACSAEARAEGVKRGLRVREAQLRCPALTVHPHDAEADARAFEPIITLIEEVVPGVQLLRPGLCAVRARGAARYYGGEREAAHVVLDRLLREGHPPAVVGIADDRYTAEQAALHTLDRVDRPGSGPRMVDSAGPPEVVESLDDPVCVVPVGGSAEFLAPLPIEAIGDAELAPLLRRLGARTLRDLAALDPTNVRARFGQAGADAHERASGCDRRAVIPRVPPRDLDVSIDFEPPLDRVDQVAFALRTVAERFAAGITRAGLVCTTVRVTVTTDRQHRQEREWSHPRHFTPGDLVDRVRWQLQGSTTATDAGLASPIARVSLSPVRVDAIANHEEGLWGRNPDERIHHGLSRIQSMLGHEAVLTAVAGGGRLLAERRVLVPWGDAPPTPERLAADRPWPGSIPAPSPATIYDPPLPVRVFDAAGVTVDVDPRGRVTAPPAWMTGDDATRRRQITAWAGPWPVRQRWWDPARARRIDRFQVLDDAGDGWLLLLEHHRWQVEARYD